MGRVCLPRSTCRPDAVTVMRPSPEAQSCCPLVVSRQYESACERVEKAWNSAPMPSVRGRPMIWLRTAWVTGRLVGPPVLDEIRRASTPLVTDLLNAAFRLPAGNDPPMSHLEDRHLRLVRGNFEAPHPGDVLSEFRIYPDGAIVTSESVAGELIEMREPRNLDPRRLREALLRAMFGVLELWKIVDGTIVAGQPVFDVHLRNAGRCVLGADTGCGGRPSSPISSCPDPVRVFDAPKVWLLSDEDEMRRFADDFMLAVEAAFKRWRTLEPWPPGV